MLLGAAPEGMELVERASGFVGFGADGFFFFAQGFVHGEQALGVLALGFVDGGELVAEGGDLGFEGGDVGRADGVVAGSGADGC